MSFTDRLLLWLHIAFAIFTLGPVTVAIMATPRYIRSGDLAVLRYLSRTTGIFGLLTIGVLLFGILLGRGNLGQGWLSASMTLFVVSAALLALVFRDQRRAINAIAKELAVAGTAAAAAADSSAATGALEGEGGVSTQPARSAGGTQPSAAAGGQGNVSALAGHQGGAGGTAATPGDGARGGETSASPVAAGTPGRGPAGGRTAGSVATVERGRIATMAGVIAALWLAILVLMVWHG